MSQYDWREPFTTEPETTPKYKVMRIKHLLAKKASLDKEIDDLVRQLPDKERRELYIHNEYFPEERIYE